MSETPCFPESHRKAPSYRRHRSSGQAIVSLPRGDGTRRDVLLGRYGTKESRVEYARVIAEWEANGRRVPAPVTTSGPTVNELIVAFMEHADRYYRRPDGTLTNEYGDHVLTMRPLTALYGHTAAAAFGPLALEAVRKRMIGSDLARGTVNQRIGRIKRMFRWGVSKELIPATVSYALDTVEGLARGRSEAREGRVVKPVAEWIVEATLPHVLPAVRAMIRLQVLTGMRSGEVCTMRACDLDTTGKVWLYKPPVHKLSHRNCERTIALGPKAQAIVREFLVPETTAYLFSPRRAMERRAADLRARRRSRVQPSQQDRRTPRRKRAWGDRYSPHAYLVAVRRGADKADRQARQAAEDEAARRDGREPVRVPDRVPAGQRLVPGWHPHQLRHVAATQTRKRFGLEHAQAVLGHARADVTQIYAERDLTLAERVALEVG
jgi:integrase